MFIKKKTLRDVGYGGEIHFLDDMFLTLSFTKRNIQAYDLSDFTLKWETDSEDYYCTLINHMIAGMDMQFYDRNGKSLYQKTDDEMFMLELCNQKHLIAYRTVPEEKAFYHMFDTKTMAFIKKDLRINWPLLFVGEDMFACKGGPNYSEVSLYNFMEEKELWTRELAGIIAYRTWRGEYPGTVKKIYRYKDKLIISAGNCVLALSLRSGEILWRQSYEGFQPCDLNLLGNRVYFGQGCFYSGINMDTGKKVLDTELVCHFDDPPGRDLAMMGGELTYYKGYFYGCNKSVPTFLAKIEPRTGIIKEYQILEGVSSYLAPPQFHGNKMFLLDTLANYIHVYEKEPERSCFSRLFAGK